MAKHKRHRRRHYRGMVSIPGLGGLFDAFKTPVVKDLGMGVAAGLAGAVGVQLILPKLGVKIPAQVEQFTPLIGGLAAGGLLYALGKKNPQRAKLQLAGATIGGGAVLTWGFLKTKVPGLSGYVNAPSMSGYTRVPGMQGVLFDNPGQMVGGGYGNYGGVLFNNALPSETRTSLGQLMDAAIEDSSEDIAQAAAP